MVAAIHSDGSQADEWVDKKMLASARSEYRSIVRTEQDVLPQVDGIVYVSEAARKGMARHVGGLDRDPVRRGLELRRRSPASTGDGQRA